MALLPYALQCDELRKIAALESWHGPAAETPPLLVLSDAAGAAPPCVVCGRAAAGLCARCRGAAYCSEEHQATDWHWHARVCTQLGHVAEDAAWLAGASETTLSVLGSCARNAAVPRNWQEHRGTAPDRSSARDRVHTRLASRPLTLALFIDRLGLAASAASGDGRLRIHVIGAARAELDVPGVLYQELARFWPAIDFRLALVGPELPAGARSPVERSEKLRCVVHRGVYGRALWRLLGQPDLIAGFHCGLPLYPTWAPTLHELIGAGPPLLITCYRRFEQEAEARLLDAVGATRVVEPEPNPFASLAARRSTTIVNDVTYDNAHAMVVK